MLAKAAGVVKRASTLSWSELAPLAASYTPPEPATGPAHSQSLLRTFGHAEEAVRVTLYRDYHAWCPYCQKVWLWLEEKRVPYKVQKVTMFCYGTKEQWYKRIVPSGMLPAAEIDGRVVTESDVILEQLEAAFGALGEPMAAITAQRRLERQLFSAWCDWLCRPSSSDADDAAKQTAFENVLQRLESEMGATAGPWLRGGAQPSTADIIFVPYVERMSASLYYYKGFTMRDASRRPALCRWFDALEALESYRGTQSDFHTHVHDLPPQMGGCFANNTSMQRINAARVDNGPWVRASTSPVFARVTACTGGSSRHKQRRATHQLRRGSVSRAASQGQHHRLQPLRCTRRRRRGASLRAHPAPNW